MSKKEIAVISLLVAVIVGLFSGMISLAFSQQAKFQEQSKQECLKVSRLSNADDSHYQNGTCYLIYGNKLERVAI